MTVSNPAPSSAGLITVFKDYWQDQVDRQLEAATVTNRHTRLHACRPDFFRLDPILYLLIG